MSTHIAKPRSFKIFTAFRIWMLALLTVMVLGVIGGVYVLQQGLHVTNLTDLVPWGLWITIDLSSIAMSAGAFSLCAVVYLVGIKRFQPVARTATYIGLIGYTMAVLCLLLDIGRPDRFWHALVYWNPHSVLWEVTICVTLYLCVLALETLPILARSDWMQHRLPRVAHYFGKVHHIAPILAVVGLGLSMLHQSSLGATYGVLKARPFWYRPDLTVLFIISAVAGGIALTILASMVASTFSKRARVKDELLDTLAFVVGWMLIGYLYFRFWDSFAMTYTYTPGRTEGLNLVTQGTLSFNFWVGEILLGAVVPIVILLKKNLRRNPVLRMLALLLVVGGVVAYRWDTNLAGQMVLLTYLPQEISARYTEYFPSAIEFITGAGIVAYGLFVFTIGVRYFKVVDHTVMPHEFEPEVPTPQSATAITQ
jgi:molybdopterin-containing oxidoreductase family membrane subunit